MESTGKRFYFALDISGYMSGGEVAGVYGLASAMVIITARIDQDYIIKEFSARLVDVGITPKMDLDTIMRKTRDRNFVSTDCNSSNGRYNE